MFSKKIWLTATSMGYGHQRAAYSLKEIALGNEILRADDYPGIPERDKKFWQRSKRFYEFISRFKSVPLVGGPAFAIFDYFQRISKFSPPRDLSKPNFVLKQTYKMMEKGWGKNFIKRLEKSDGSRPIVTTFSTIAFMAEFFRYPGEIFCLICDTDISRSWAPLEGGKSRIKYFAPTETSASRLEMYGIKKENVILAGHPLPLANVGKKGEQAAKDFQRRIPRLNPSKKQKDFLERKLGKIKEREGKPLALMFAIGGAGAQKQTGLEIMISLAEKAKRSQVALVFSVGTRDNLKDYFLKNAKKLGISQAVEIIFASNAETYFSRFNEKLKEVDILWTKPSELCFFSALGLPLILSDPIGSQEKRNREWVLEKGAALLQKNPRFCDKWLFEYLRKGLLAEAAINGFYNIDKLGREEIIKELL